MSNLKRLLKYVWPYWPAFLLALVAMVLAALFETATGALLVPIFNQFSQNPVKSKTLFDLGGFVSNDWYRAWLSISAMLLAFTILKGIFEFVSSYLMARIGQYAVVKLRDELYQHLLLQSSSFFEKHRTNFLVSRLITSCSAIENAVSSNLRDILREGCML